VNVCVWGGGEWRVWGREEEVEKAPLSRELQERGRKPPWGNQLQLLCTALMCRIRPSALARQALCRLLLGTLKHNHAQECTHHHQLATTLRLTTVVDTFPVGAAPPPPGT
jgi:hypothetical protein